VELTVTEMGAGAATGTLAWLLCSCEKVPLAPCRCDVAMGPSAAGAPTCATPVTALDGSISDEGAPAIS